MIPIHNSPYFDVREWVDKKTYNILGFTAQWMIDPKIVLVADMIRTLTGKPVTVNNWHFENPRTVYQSSGFRAVWDKTGGQLSQHRTGRAADLKVKGWTPKQVQNLIYEHSAAFIDAGLTTMESLDFTATWLHCDVRPRLGEIVEGRPFLIVSP